MLDDNGIVTGFLTEAPSDNVFSSIGKLDKSAQPLISWERREKWCKQLVEAVSAVHRQGKVVGSLDRPLKNGAGIDSDDNLILWKNFWTVFPFEGRDIDLATLPPEYHRQLPSIGSRVPVVPETDLFQLGLALWQVAANVRLSPGYCLDSCRTSLSSHTFPVRLPSIGPPVPQYLEQIIGICLSEDPTKRKRAVELLELIPATGAKGCEARSAQAFTATAENSLRCLTRLSDSLALFPHWWCDLCGKRITSHRYHCRRCAFGDFDLCTNCFTQGRHCSDHSHYLMEIKCIGGASDERSFMDAIEGGHRYFTTPKDNGQRDFVIM